MAQNGAGLDITGNPEITGLDIKVLLTIAYAADPRGVLKATAEDIAGHVKASRPRVSGALKKLADMKLIEKVRDGEYAVSPDVAPSMASRQIGRGVVEG